MRNIKVLEKDYVIKGEVAVITEKLEKEISKQELYREIQQYELNQQRIIAQMNQLKQQYEQIEETKTQIKSILAGFEDSVPDIPEIDTKL